MELPGGGLKRSNHSAAAVRNDGIVHIIEFGGEDSGTALASTTILQLGKYLGGLT